MNLDYICTATSNMKPALWKGHISLIRKTNPYEMEVTARDSSFHIICGKHEYGHFLCIPNWNIGTEIASFDDCFWNLERIETYYPKISKVDALSIVNALEKLNEYISIVEEAG